MAHQASYRVYRPRRFSEVLGQSRTVDTLREAVRQQRLSHAYVFAGPRGTGKTSVARILAKAVNCENRGADGDPCLECASCRNIELGQHLDVIEIDAASNRGIDEIRDIKERITHQTAMSRYKVYIIDEAHMLTPEAFNAFLKTLEEPPSHALFILATTEAHKLPITVLSRCQRYEFKRLTIPVIMERLRYVAQKEAVDLDPEALELLAEAADGALRDALSLFDQVVATAGRVSLDGVTRVAGMTGPQHMQSLVNGLAATPQDLLAVVGVLRAEGLDEKLILRDLARAFRDILLYRAAGGDLFAAYRRQAIQALSDRLPEAVPDRWWIEAADQLAQADGRLRGGFPADLALELALLKVQQMLRVQSAETVAAPRPPSGALREPPPSRSVVPSEPQGQGQPDPFQDVLEAIRRERPTTHALFDKATGVVEPDGVLTVYFEFPAHRQLIDQSQNRDVVDRAIKSVLGSHATYRFVDGPPRAFDSERAATLADKVKDWFGPDVTLVGFDQE